MIVIIDNYDSFTYNLYQFLGEFGHEIKVFRNDKVTIEELKNMDISHIIISPGPKYPKDAGISMEVIKELGKSIPTIGVCLGHQGIGEVFGGKVVKARKTMHGKISTIYHNQKDIFKDIKSPIKAVRYHSLVIDIETFSNELEIMAKSDDGEIMGVRHRDYPIFGIQFHPESIASESGKEILKNFIELGGFLYA